MTTTILPPVGSVWYRTLYPDRIFVILAQYPNALGKYGAVQIKQMNTGTVRIEPAQSFTWHHSPLEQMETK